MIWNNIFSHCPFLGFTKNVFFNSFVLRKGSDGVDYVNGGRFYVCTLFQYFVYYLDSWSPRAATITTPFWQYCKRGKAQSKHREAMPVNIAQNKSLLIKWELAVQSKTTNIFFCIFLFETFPQCPQQLF